MTTSNTATLAGAALALATLAVSAAPAAAQQTMDGPWLALAGCWVEVEAPTGAPMTCVVPADAGGAEFLTVTAAGVTERQTVRADGVERPVEAGGCAGVQAADLSRTGQRVFTRSRLSCDGGTERSTQGLIAVVSQDEWIQVRALTVGQGSVSWVTRYRAASSDRVAAAGLPEIETATRDRATAIETARMAASAGPTVEDVIEAHARTEPEAVRAWIVEHGEPLDLDAAALVRLADAGVGESVIDVVVAVTYPERFAVAREPERRAGWEERYGYDRYRYDDWRYRSPFFYDPFYYRYARYSPYGYSSWRHGYYGSPTVIVITPAGEQTPRGRAVNGRGYTRGTGDATSRSLRPGSGSSTVRAGSGYTGSRAASGSSGSSSSKGKAKPRGGN